MARRKGISGRRKRETSPTEDYLRKLLRRVKRVRVITKKQTIQFLRREIPRLGYLSRKHKSPFSWEAHFGLLTLSVFGLIKRRDRSTWEITRRGLRFTFANLDAARDMVRDRIAITG
jgi:hypothetical protein